MAEEEVADLLASEPGSPQSPKGEKEKPKKDEAGNGTRDSETLLVTPTWAEQVEMNELEEMETETYPSHTSTPRCSPPATADPPTPEVVTLPFVGPRDLREKLRENPDYKIPKKKNIWNRVGKKGKQSVAERIGKRPSSPPPQAPKRKSGKNAEKRGQSLRFLLFSCFILDT